jgi:predicted membrane protein
VTLDLTQAKLSPEGAVVDVMTAFGGTEIVVPLDCRVSFSGVPIFGGFSDKTTTHSDPVSQGGPSLNVRGTVMFGGVDVKNRS